MVKTIRAHTNIVRRVAWSPEGAQLATAGADHVLKLWETESWRERPFTLRFRESVYGLCFAPDGQQLAAVARNEPVKVWGLNEQSMVAELRGHTALVTSIDFCPDGWRLVSASEDGTVRLWDSAQSAGNVRRDGHLGKARTVAFSPAGNLLASAGADDGSIVIWDSATTQPLRKIQASGNASSEIAFSPDGKSIASFFIDRLNIWDVETTELTLEVIFDELAAVAWAPDGKLLGVQSSNGDIRLVKPGDGDVYKAWSPRNGPVGRLVFSPDGELVAIAGGAKSVQIWRIASQQLVGELFGHTAPVVNVAFDKSRSLIASASNDLTIRLWDVVTGRCLRTLEGHTGTPYGLTLTPDGTRVVSGSTDQSVKIWDAKTGLELQSLTGHSNWVRSVAISPDATQLASAGYDGTVRIWHASMRSANWTTAREAAALIHHLADRASSRESLLDVLSAHPSISSSVRTAAVHQAKTFLIHVPALLAGHHAADRHDWPTAMAAFERAANLEPNDPLNWYWLAIASLAGARGDKYQQSSEQLVRYYSADSRRAGLHALLATWLIPPRERNQLKVLERALEGQDKNEFGSYRYLFRLRMGENARELSGPSGIHAMLGVQPQDWYILALVWLKVGNSTKAKLAYQEGLIAARSRTQQWDAAVYNDILQREVEALLAAEPAATTTSPPGPSAASDSR